MTLKHNQQLNKNREWDNPLIEDMSNISQISERIGNAVCAFTSTRYISISLKDSFESASRPPEAGSVNEVN